MEAEWQLAPNDRGWPMLVSIVPGGSVTFEHRNLQGVGNQISASINTQNFLQPQDDLGFKARPQMLWRRCLTCHAPATVSPHRSAACGWVIACLGCALQRASTQVVTADGVRVTESRHTHN